ncbi:MAG: putative peptidoglycan-binding protein [Clostridia bacterium]|nr:putative peptidoglycan-binding protein [Clostridia bacterium]
MIFSLSSVAYADTYKDGSKGQAVEDIQQQLKKLGFFQGEATGYFGPQTVTAVKRFQLKRGLHADGVVGSGTYKYLFEGVSKTESSNSKTQANDKHVISIKEIQTALKKLGFYTGAVDGLTGKNTEDAIIKFQKSNKLTADGIVGTGTSKLLLAAADKSTKSETISTNAMSIKEIQTALKKLGYYTGSVDGVTGSKTKSAIQKFQKANKLTADGVVGTTTKNKLVSAAAAKTATSAKAPAAASTKAVTPATATAPATAVKSGSGVELLDWWKEASKVFKLGSIATVTDVKTGKAFKIVRTYGTNHADVEALTAEDSKIIKDIWGGWSWTRRPVIVEVNDRKLAASMAAMPHAGVDSQPANTYVSQRSGGYSRGANLDKIKDNGMSGHMDVHFLNSKTHGSNKVDSKHQAAIKQAAKY